RAQRRLLEARARSRSRRAGRRGRRAERGDVRERSSAARMAHRRPRVHSRPRRTAAHLLHRSKRSDLRRTSSDETLVRGEGGGGSGGTVSPPAEAGGLGFYWCAANCFMNASLRSFISAGVRSSL